MGKFQSPIDVGAVLDEVMNLNAAKETTVSVSVYIDDSAAEDLVAYTRNAYASAASNARISIAYLSNADFQVNPENDFAVVVAGRDMRVGERAADLRGAGVPVMVVTTSPNLVAQVAEEKGHPIPKGDLVAPETLTIRDSEAAEILANLPSNAGPDQAVSYEHGDDSPQEAADAATEAVVEEVFPGPAEEPAVADGAEAVSVAGTGDDAPQGEEPAGALRTASARPGSGLFSSLVGRASAVAGALRKSAAAAASAAATAAEPAKPVNPFLVDVPEGLDADCPLDAERTQLLATRMGLWVIDACKPKSLSMALAFPFVRRPFANDIVNVTSVQNAGIGVVVFLPGADMPLMTLNQAKMLLQVAAAYGQPMTLERAKELVAVVAGAFACRTAARQVAGVVPVLGWAVKGVVGYTGTLAMGKAAIEYFESGAGVGGVAGLASKMTDAVQKVVVLAQGDQPGAGEPEAPKDPAERLSDLVAGAGKFANAAAGTAGPVAKAAAKAARTSFFSGADSILASLGGSAKK